MIAVGSNFRVSTVERDVTPNPFDHVRMRVIEDGYKGTLTNGMSFMLKTTTPWCSGVSSVMRPRWALATWFPYKKGISPLGFIHTCTHINTIQDDISLLRTLYFAYCAR